MGKINLTDEEIVKALELCKINGQDNYKICVNCACIDLHPFTCVHKLKGYALDLIHRLRSEKDSIKKGVNDMIQQAVKDTAKAIANWLPTTVTEDKNSLSMIIKEHYGVEVE